MNTKRKSLRAIILGVFILVSILGYTTPALADGPNQPNYGTSIDGVPPITVDGDTSDWDLDVDGPDHFATLYREDINTHLPDPNIPEADVYMRFVEDVLYVLVLSQNGQNIRTTNGTFVSVNGDDQNLAVSYADAPPDGTLPELQWVNLDGTLAEGWEAAFAWIIDPEDITHTILVHSLILDGTIEKAWTEVEIDVYPSDYGDLPDSYGTVHYNPEPLPDGVYGPKHTAGTLRLGVQVDGEVDGQPETNPILDDQNGRNDEDGVITIGNWLENTPTIQYTVNGCPAPAGCYLNAWIDWGEFVEDPPDSGEGSWQPDGTFDSGDEVFINLQVFDGTDTLPIAIPDGVGFAATFNARFRLCDAIGGCATPHALSESDAPLGEVEDYQWSFAPNAVALNSFSATSLQDSTRLFVVVGALAMLIFTGAITLIRKRRLQGSHN